MEKEKILIAENIVRTYSSGGQKVNAIKGINLTVMKGEIVIIVGRSGSAKPCSTSLQIGKRRHEVCCEHHCVV